MSSSKVLIIIFAVVLVGVVGSLAFFYTKKTPQLVIQATTPISQNIVTPTPTSTLPAGNSDQQLNQDSQSIDDSFNSLDADLHSVDQSLSDQSTNLQ